MPLSLIEHFDKAAERWPERDFLVDAERRLSYRAVQGRSHRIARALLRDGVGPGSRVAVHAANSARAFECVIGALRAGAVWVPVSTRNHLDDTAHTLQTTQAALLFHDSASAEAAAALQSRCPALRSRVPLDGLDAWLDGLSDAPLPDPDPVSADTLATLFSSGGTTGRPKGVRMSVAAWEAMMAGTLALNTLPPDSHPIHLVAAPMTHAAGGSALAMLPLGATHVLLPGFDAGAVLEAIERHRISHLFLPPTAIYKLLAHPAVRAHDYSSLRAFNYASAPMAPERLLEALDIFGPVMTTGFGQTETGLNVTHFSPAEHAQALADGRLDRFQTCGRVTPFFRVETLDDHGNVLPRGTVGEVVVRGGSLMQGYLDQPEETRAASLHGWHHTGDIGRVDAEGWLTLLDRKRDIIVSGGFNVYPSEIERVLLQHPGVADCAVIGVPDPLWGEAVKAVVEAAPGHTLDPEELRRFARAHLGSHQVPKSFDCTTELPRSPAGKVLKRALRERYWQSQSRRI